MTINEMPLLMASSHISVLRIAQQHRIFLNSIYQSKECFNPPSNYGWSRLQLYYKAWHHHRCCCSISMAPTKPIEKLSSFGMQA